MTTHDARDTTLFVSRLPYSLSSAQLTTAFEAHGPLKRAFVVTTKEDPDSGIQPKSKGVGYVAFALPEDAATALEQMQGALLGGESGRKGRKIHVEWADQKPARVKRSVGTEEKRGRDEEEGESAAAPAKRPRTALPSKPRSAAGPDKDPDAVRTLLITGLSLCKPAADEKTIYKRARKLGDVDAVLYPLPQPVGQGPPNADAAHIVFRTPNHAMDAVPRLHNHTFKGALLSAVLKKRADGAARLEARMRPETKAAKDKVREQIHAAQKAQGTKTSTKGKEVVEGDNKLPTEVTRASRLIVRNLPFDITIPDLRAVFLPFGPVYAIDLPQKEEEKKGTAEDVDNMNTEEVTEVDVATNGDEANDRSNSGSESGGDDGSEDEDEDEDSDDGASAPSTPAAPATLTAAEKAAQASRAKGRGFAFVWFVSLQSARTALEAVNGRILGRGTAEAATLKGARGKNAREQAKAALAKVKEGAMEHRKVAVDWAVGKKVWEEMEREKKEKGEATDAEESGSEGESDLDPVEIGEGDEDEDKSDEEEDESEHPPPPPEGSTLFLRNLPYTATDADLAALFRVFGPLRYARVTMEPPQPSSNGTPTAPRSRGTGFVCFWNVEDAEKVLERAEQVARLGNGPEGGAILAAPGANPFALPKGGPASVLTPDVSAPLTASLALQGRLLSITRAVARSTAGSLEARARAQREKGDKRNTHLMREGVPLPSAPAHATVPALGPAETERRLAAFEQRRGQLTRNPTLYVSKTRLSIRQLPLFATDRTIKRLALHAGRAFKDEVRSGARVDLSEMELQDDTLSPAAHSAKSARQPGRPTAVLQAKVVRQTDRLDALTGAPRSRGYGFIELRTHKDALRVLRWANGNGEVADLMVQWWREELEDVCKRVKKEVGEKEGEEKVELETRVRRLEKKISELIAREKGGSKPAKEVDDEEVEDSDAGDNKKPRRAPRGTAIVVEFSIENATITKQRSERANEQREGASRRKARDESRANGGGSADEAASAAESDHELEVPEAPSSRKRKDDGKGGRNELAARKARAKAAAKVEREKGRGERKGTAIGKGRGGKREDIKGTSTRNRREGKDEGEKKSNGDATDGKDGANPLGGLIGRKRKMKKMGRS